MKQTLITVISSIICSVIAVLLFQKIQGPREFVLRESNKAQFTNFNDLLFSGDLQRNMHAVAPTSFTKAASVTTPTVVNIKALSGGTSDFTENVGATSASGVIISPDGYIITNNHVIEDVTDIQITLNNREVFTNVTIVGTDPSTDLALLKINTDQKLPFAIFGNSDSIQVGEWVMAVGNPFNLESTVTAGIISAKARNINILEGSTSIESFIQSDAVVNPGNSGGALVNTNGDLIGINTAILTKSGRYEGYAFAVPSNLARKVVQDLKEFGVVQRGFLGIGVEDLTGNEARNLGLSNVNGVMVTRVTNNSAASDAGLLRGDVIVSIDNKETFTKPSLLELVGRYRPGSEIAVEYIRSGRKYKTKVTLRNKLNTTTLIETRKDGILSKAGFELRDLSTEELRSMRVSGVKVVSIVNSGRIARTNMDPGFIITNINGRAVESVQDAIRILESLQGTVILEGIYEEFNGDYIYKFIL